jgi:hypothetical protein
MTRVWLRGSGAPTLAAAVLFCGLMASAVVAPAAVTASCGEVLDFAETAREPGISMFTGRAVREVSGYRVEFAVDRWYTGAHPARVIDFQESAVFLVEPPAAGVIPAVVARTVSGDVIGLVRGEPVFVAAFGSGKTGYVPAVCGIGAVPLASPEGRDYLAKAVAKFGAGLQASQMPATDVAADAVRPAPAPGAPLLPVVTFGGGLAGALLIFGRRDRRAVRRA